MVDIDISREWIHREENGLGLSHGFLSARGQQPYLGFWMLFGVWRGGFGFRGGVGIFMRLEIRLRLSAG